MEQANTEFSCYRLVIWARKQRFIHLDAGVGNKGASGQYGKAAGEAEKESGSEIFHADGTKVRIFTGTQDSIRHQIAVWSRLKGVMFSALWTDMKTKWQRLRPEVRTAGAAGLDWLFDCLQKAATVC